MNDLPTNIQSLAQYNHYCTLLEELVFNETKTDATEDEIELLTRLIETFDQQNNSFDASDHTPVSLLKYLMEGRQMKARDLAEQLEVSKGLISDILNYKKDLSNDVVRKLSTLFKVHQEAFNRPFLLNQGVW